MIIIGGMNMRESLKNRFIIGISILIILLIEPISALVSNLVDKDESKVRIEYLERENENLKQELRTIQEAIDLQSYEKDLLIGKVITRNIYGFYDELIIDKGSREGVSVGDSVISKDGFLGVVKTVRESESIITLITNKELNIAVKVNDVYGNFNSGRVKNITNQAKINVGDAVYTSGLTDIDAGLYIGKVAEVTLDKQEIEQELKIDLAVNTHDINYVGVVK